MRTENEKLNIVRLGFNAVWQKKKEELENLEIENHELKKKNDNLEKEVNALEAVFELLEILKIENHELQKKNDKLEKEVNAWKAVFVVF